MTGKLGNQAKSDTIVHLYTIVSDRLGEILNMATLFEVVGYKNLETRMEEFLSQS
jgi:hypothetical protein